MAQLRLARAMVNPSAVCCCTQFLKFTQSSSRCHGNLFLSKRSLKGHHIYCLQLGSTEVHYHNQMQALQALQEITPANLNFKISQYSLIHPTTVICIQTVNFILIGLLQDFNTSQDSPFSSNFCLPHIIHISPTLPLHNAPAVNQDAPVVKIFHVFWAVATGAYYPKLEFENHKNQYFSWLLRSEHVETNIFGNRMSKSTI